MKTLPLKAALLSCLALACALGGCSGSLGSHTTGGAGTASVSLLMTDAAPSNVGLISFVVTISSALLQPGNVQLVGSPITTEVTRLQTETALLSVLNVTPGTYTSITITYSNPVVTFQNDTGSTLTVGSVNCPNGQICTATPTASTSLTGTITLGSSLTAATGTPTALLLDLNLANAISGTMTVDLIGGSTVAPVTAQSGGFGSIEGVVGTVSSVDSVNGTFDLATPFGTYVVATSTSAVPPTAYLNFPTTSTCTTSVFACLAVGQIVTVNLTVEGVQTSGALLASDIFFELSSSSVPDVEGIVVATTGLTPPAQFEIAVVGETSAVSGVPVGSLINVEPSLSPAATYSVDDLGANTSAYSFNNVASVIVGQEVSLTVASGSTSSLLVAGRIQLESSRFTAQVSNTAYPDFYVNMLPAYFGSLSQIQVNTASGYTEFGGTAISVTQIIVGKSVSVRGQLFANGLTPVLVASRVVQH